VRKLTVPDYMRHGEHRPQGGGRSAPPTEREGYFITQMWFSADGGVCKQASI
jgi:hypothetical protein